MCFSVVNNLQFSEISEAMNSFPVSSPSSSGTLSPQAIFGSLRRRTQRRNLGEKLSLSEAFDINLYAINVGLSRRSAGTVSTLDSVLDGFVRFRRRILLASKKQK